MVSSKDRLSIFENLLAKHGIENVLREYSKAMSALNGLQTYQEMTPPMPQITPTENTGGTISAPPMESTAQGNSMLNQPLQ